MIDCYDISIKPFEDCCTVYVPKAPAISPKIDKAEKFETNFDYKTLVEEAVNNTRSITIDMNSDIDFASLGFEVREVIDMLKDKKWLHHRIMKRLNI